MQHCALVSDAAGVLIEGAIACISLLIFLMLRLILVVTAVVYTCFMFCLMCAGVTSVCILMSVVYL